MPTFSKTVSLMTLAGIGDPASSGVQAAGYAKGVVFDFVETRSGHHAADLRLLSKRQQIGNNVEMFAAPIATSRAHAALHLVENEKDVVLVANRSQLSEPFA